MAEAENVVDEQQHVLILFIAEILGDGQRGESHAQSGAGRLVHLSVNEADARSGRNHRKALVVELGFAVFVLLGFDNVGFNHLIVKVVAFAGALADTRKHRDAAVQLRDVVDQLHDDDRLADARAAERADLAALEERADEIDHLDAGGEHFLRGGLLSQRRGRSVNGVINIVAVLVLVRLHGALLVHGFAGDVEHAAHHGIANGHADRLSRVGEFHAALEALGGAHRHGAHPVVTQMLLHLERQLGIALTGNIELHGQCVVDGGQAVGELRIHYRPNDLYNLAFVHFLLVVLNQLPSAICAVVISSNSLVIAAWRILLNSSVKSFMRSFALSVAFFIATIFELNSLALASSRIWCT